MQVRKVKCAYEVQDKREFDHQFPKSKVTKKTEIQVKCVRCKKTFTIKVHMADYELWRERKLTIRKAMPYLKENEIELFSSGNCMVCFNKCF